MEGGTQADSSRQLFPQHRLPSQDAKAPETYMQVHVCARLIRAMVGTGKPFHLHDFPATPPPPCRRTPHPGSQPYIVIRTARNSKGGGAAGTPRRNSITSHCSAPRPGSPRFPRTQVNQLCSQESFPGGHVTPRWTALSHLLTQPRSFQGEPGTPRCCSCLFCLG